MIAAEVIALATQRGVTIATAESCTGGLIGAALTEVAGSSAVFLGGVIAYANAVKLDQLGVFEADLDAHGAVSEPVAAQMAEGARKTIGADLAVSVTGVAGPGGGSAAKPVGTVCFGLSHAGKVETQTEQFGDVGRAEVRRLTVEHALAMMGTALDE